MEYFAAAGRGVSAPMSATAHTARRAIMVEERNTEGESRRLLEHCLFAEDERAAALRALVGEFDVGRIGEVVGEAEAGRLAHELAVLERVPDQLFPVEAATEMIRGAEVVDADGAVGVVLHVPAKVEA